MIVTYAPEGHEPQSWEFDPGKVRASRAEMIERRAGESWETWLMQVQQGSMRARRVLLWHLMSQTHPTLRYEDAPDFMAGELTIQHTRAELAEMRERIAAAGLPDDQASQVIMAIDLEMSKAPEGGEGEGKAPSKSSASATSGRSRKS